MKKRLPHLLTAVRFPLALCLLAAPMPRRFLTLYLFCGLTDLLDGFLARRLGVCSVFGAALDSAADLAVTAALVWRLWPMAAPGPWLTAWALAVAVLWLFAALAAWLRFGHFGFLHTWSSKTAGALLWLYPFFLMLAQLRWPLICVLAAAYVSALEELAIQCRAVRWEPDRRSLWDMPGQRAPGQEKRV